MGSVYLEHLTPMTLNEKSLSWLHSASKRLDIKMLSHKYIYMAKKSKQDMARNNTSETDDGHVSVEASIPWTENTDVMELVEADMNLVAAKNMIRLWSYHLSYFLSFG